ncbi:flagellar protein FliO/FliZ [Desulfovibrio gilichinskyi]|uniref:Flagellar protein n=2 Tax=Desulfovibrio gilichinskyi TaxID=1519643 RepID=A0A1X7E0G8_9BACT|nr:flagellar protein FliO/FliZ [Desulfovibrio gilichinskyi]
MPIAMAPPEVGFSSVLKMSGALFFILAMLLLAFYILRRLNLGGTFSPLRSRDLQVVERLPLGPRQNITVVKYRGQDLVLGVTQDRITLLQTRDEVNGKDDKKFAGILKKETSGSADS